MSTDFGTVQKYFPDRGFGFVAHTFVAGHQSEVFFHIKNLKRTHSELAERLDREESIGTIYFWYETEITSKGEQVRTVLKSDAIPERVTDHLPSFVSKVETVWRNIDSAIPVWLREVTTDLMGANRASELSSERDALASKRREVEESRRKEQEALQKIEEVKRQQRIEEWEMQMKERMMQQEIEEKEFKQLVAEIAHKRFTHSNQVSWYIKNNRLGNKYKNISGIVQLEEDGNTWDFEGGFPPTIYARLCEELGLSNQGSRARAVGFKPFKDL